MEQTMADQFGADWRTTLGYEKDALVPYAVAALLNYLHETQKRGVERIKTVQNYADAQYMRLSPVTRANLELTETMRGREKRGTLLWVLDKTETSMGKRLLRSWIEQPLVDAEAINARLCAVQALYSASIARADLKEALGHVFDIERLTTRILYGSATPREVKALGDTCAMLPQVKAQAATCGAPLLTQLADQIDLLEDVLQNIQTALVDDPPANMKDGGAIRAGFNSEVDELRDIMHGGKGYLSNLEARYREETGIPKLKIGFNKVFGYYIEVSRSYTDSVPDTFTRKQTLTTGERYITPELKELENKILGANERLLVLEHQLFADLLSSISAEVVRHPAHGIGCGPARCVGRLCRGGAAKQLRHSQTWMRAVLWRSRRAATRSLNRCSRAVCLCPTIRCSTRTRTGCCSSPARTWPVNLRTCARMR